MVMRVSPPPPPSLSLNSVRSMAADIGILERVRSAAARVLPPGNGVSRGFANLSSPSQR